MPASYFLTPRADGLILTAAIYNADHQNHIDHMTPTYIDDHSGSIGQFKSEVDPGEQGTENVPNSLAGELERLRFALRELKGTDFWYESAPKNFTNLFTAQNTYTALQTFADIKLVDTDSGGTNTGPDLFLERASSSPAIDDNLATIRFNGRTNTDNTVTYARLLARIKGVSDASYAGSLQIAVPSAGVLDDYMTFENKRIICGSNIQILGNGKTDFAQRTTPGWELRQNGAIGAFALNGITPLEVGLTGVITGATDPLITFHVNGSTVATVTASSAGFVSYGNFLAHHPSEFVVPMTHDPVIGTLLSSVGVFEEQNERLPMCEVTHEPRDPEIYGAFGGRDNSGKVIVWAIGAGQALVKGPVNAGDFLTSGPEPGVAIRQDTDQCKTYTLGKARKQVPEGKTELIAVTLMAG